MRDSASVAAAWRTRRLRRGKRRARLRELRVELFGVEPRQHLALGHAIVEIDQHLGDAAVDFGADIDLVQGLECAGGADRHRERSAHDIGGDVVRLAGCRRRRRSDR